MMNKYTNACSSQVMTVAWKQDITLVDIATTTLTWVFAGVSAKKTNEIGRRKKRLLVFIKHNKI